MGTYRPLYSPENPKDDLIHSVNQNGKNKARFFVLVANIPNRALQVSDYLHKAF